MSSFARLKVILHHLVHIKLANSEHAIAEFQESSKTNVAGRVLSETTSLANSTLRAAYKKILVDQLTCREDLDESNPVEAAPRTGKFLLLAAP